MPDEKILYVGGGLSEVERNSVIIHEIGHLLNEHEINELNAPAVRLRQEREANEYLADQLITEYLESCVTPPSYVDVHEFMEQRQLSNDLYTYIDVSFRSILTA
ncbi:ImmA/IrrE family metallo-endopeptidase [Weissella ceti]|uniref:ImmA/IrrE family metallo-endopeptidase n=1 Tax=Weissella ceti TaxID=759620 RepID=A0ABT3E4Z3_9LACO|nr:ImmA/IrrE family metallo-endopeptidase [Weissella ceti]MCW0953282.1 ImmA/IrrE family metallo-endopeptidase [Weissella ceti]